MNCHKLMLLLFTLLYMAYSTAQSPAAYKLSELYDFNAKTIYGLHQAQNKHVWIATDQGLFEFDGTVFHKYINSAYQSEYSWIKEDKEGRIWCRNFSGQIFYMENNALRLFKDVKEYTASGLLEFTVTRFPEIYIGTDYGYIVADFHDGSNTRHFQTHDRDKNEYKVLSDKDTIYKESVDIIQSYKDAILYYSNVRRTVNTIQKDCVKVLFTAEKLHFFPFIYANEDDVLLLSENQDRKLQIHSYQSGIIQLMEYEKLPTPAHSAVYYDADLQKYWLGTYNGVFLLDKALQPLANPFLKGNTVSSIIKDHEGNCWMGTLHNGIYIIPSLEVRHLNSSNSMLIRDDIISMEKINRNQLILGDNLGNVYQYNISKNKMVLLFNTGTGLEKITYNPVKDVVHFSNTYGAYDPKTKKLVYPSISNIKAGTIIDSTHFLISLHSGAYITNYETSKDKLPMNALWRQHYKIINRINNGHKISHLLRLREKRSHTNTICKATKMLYVSYSDGLFTYKNAKSHKIIYRDKPLMASVLHPDPEKGVWAGNTEGVLYYIFKNEVTVIATFDTGIRHIRQKDSLLFLGTNKGLIKYNLEQQQTTVINTLDGLPSNTITDLAILSDTVFAATLKGLAKVPVTYSYKNTVAPEVHLTQMTINGHLRDFNTTLKLRPEENNLSFFLTTYALRSQKTFTYAYRIPEADSSWTTTQDNRISFTALRPNVYTFQVKAINEDGMESTQIRQVQFSIAKPFHQKWWFYTLVSIASIAVVSSLFYYRIKQRSLKTKLTDSTLTTLKAQMNPHFIFNTLTAIQSLILKKESNKAHRYLTKFATLIRENLNISEENYVYFYRELELIKTYLQLEELRFGADFEYHIAGTATLHDIKIPPMIIQPFIENAIKHGLLHKSGVKRLRIVFHQGDLLSCTITDNGIGRKASKAINSKRKDKRESFSTSVIKKRFALLRKYYKLDLGFRYMDLEENNIPAGTQVSIKIPYFKDDE